MLVSRAGQDIEAANEAALIGGCLNRGEEMLRRKEISTEAALAQPMFETAVRLAKYRQLLLGEPEHLAVRREAFSAELERLLAAIDELQDFYDAALDHEFVGRLAKQRSIA